MEVIRLTIPGISGSTSTDIRGIGVLSGCTRAIDTLARRMIHVFFKEGNRNDFEEIGDFNSQDC